MKAKRWNKKGIFLIYVLFTTTLLSIFLIGATKDAHESLFAAKKFLGERKAYWAARAGQTYAMFRLNENESWPFGGTKENGKFGTYNITEKKCQNGIKIHGKSEDGDSEFFIIFSDKSEKKNDVYTIVPDGLDDENDVRHFSYNTLKSNSIITGEYVTEIIETSTKPFSRRTAISSPGVYIVAEGRSGGYRAAIERMGVIEDPETYSGGIYTAGDIIIDLNSRHSMMSVNQIKNGRPDIYCNGSFILTRSKDLNSEKVKFPLKIEDGTLFYRKDIKISDGINSYTNRQTHAKHNFKRNLGIQIDKIENDNEFPSVEWETIKKSAKSQKGLMELQEGTYAAILDKDKDKYELYHIPTYGNKDVEGDGQKQDNQTKLIAKKINEKIRKGETAGYKPGKIDKILENIYITEKVKAEKITDSKAISVETVNKGNSRVPVIHIKGDTEAKGEKGLAFVAIDFKPGDDGTDKYESSGQSLTLMFESKQKAVRIDDDKSIFTRIPSSICYDGPIAIDGKLHGEGQIFSGSSVAFNTGSDLNVIKHEDDEETLPISRQIAIYSRGSVKMGNGGLTSSMDLLYGKIRKIMANKSAASTAYLTTKILNSTVKLTENEIKSLDATVQDIIKPDTEYTLNSFMEKAYGYTKRERRGMISSSVESNMHSYVSYYTGQTIYYLPEDEEKIEVVQQSPSSFSGIIYACGNVYADMGGGPFSLNGAIVAYGGDPSYSSNMGTGKGINEDPFLFNESMDSAGSLIVNNCSNFSLTYESTDLTTFARKEKKNTIKNFITVYCNTI